MWPIVVNFMYTGRVTLTRDNVYAISRLSDYLLMEELLNFTAEYIESTICVATSVGYFHDAVFFGADKLKDVWIG